MLMQVKKELDLIEGIQSLNKFPKIQQKIIADRGKWTHDEYIDFILVYTAYADFYYINEKENHWLVGKMGEPTFNKMKDYLIDIERIEVIYEFKYKYCSQPGEVDCLLCQIQEIINADEGMNAEEQELFIAIRHILKN